MAPAKRPGREAPEGSALKFEHLDPEGQRAVKEQWHEMGKAKTRHAAAVETAKAARDKPGSKPEYLHKQDVRVRSLESIGEHVEDKPMTVAGATQARVTRVNQGRARAAKEGPKVDPETGWKLPPVPRGSGWYFGHHAAIAAHAAQHGVDTDKAVTATTALSPQNSPSTELKGGRALIDMIGHQHEHTVNITSELRADTAKRIKDLGGPPIPKEWEGTTQKIADMHSAHIAGIASQHVTMRKAGHPTQSTADFGALGATRQSAAIQKGVEHLRGERSELETIDPHSSPKVWSYKTGTKLAVPGSREHLEYMGRAMNYQEGGPEAVEASRQTPAGFRTESLRAQTERARTQLASVRAGQAGFGSAQHTLASHAASLSNLGGGGKKATLPDTRPLRASDEGVLSPEAHTAEDTWMQSISTRQDPKSVRGPSQTGGTGTSIAKTVGSDSGLAAEKAMTKKAASGATVAPDPRIAGAALNHSINNYATRLAARKTKTPAMFVQETGWTEQRIRAEKDPDYTREQVAKNKTGIPKEPVSLSSQFSPEHQAAKAAYNKATSTMKTRKRAS